MKKTLLFLFVCVLTMSAFSQKPADPNATPEATALFKRLLALEDKGVMYGHQDDLMYGYDWWYDIGRSDIKAWVGDYPGVVGFELGEIETGRARSLDSVSFVQITELVKYFHKQNGIITISWHCINPITSMWPGIKTANRDGSAWDVDYLAANELNAVKSVLPGGANNPMFRSWLDRLARYFLTWTDENKKLIPFLFRPYHEHSGSFFWWGDTRCTDAEYAALWQYTVNYLREKGLHNILYIYNTDKVFTQEQFLKGYPGDDYADMLAVDWYGSGDEFNTNVDNALNFISKLATQKKKLAALSECGNISTDLINIMKKYKLSYFLTWRNSYQANPARRRPTNEATIQQNKTMYEHPHTLFLKDIQ